MVPKLIHVDSHPDSNLFNIYEVQPLKHCQQPCIALPSRFLDRLSNNTMHIGESYIINEVPKDVIISPDLIHKDIKLSQILKFDVASQHPAYLYSIKELPKLYLKLSKSRLTGMVVMTEICGYLMAPLCVQPGTFFAAALGTALTSASANTVNQFLEVPYDSQMNRTKSRVLVCNKLSPLHAMTFACISGLTGLTLLYTAVNGISTSLAAFNLILYTCVYTPSKRTTIFNTWIGALVGAVPPLIGYYACMGKRDDHVNKELVTNTLTSQNCTLANGVDPMTSTQVEQPLSACLQSQLTENIFSIVQNLETLLTIHITPWTNAVTGFFGSVDMVPLLVAGLLYSWQFPHFNALSWNLKHEYSRAGYRMMSAANPRLCLKTAYLHSLYSLLIVGSLLYFLYKQYAFTPTNRAKNSSKRRNLSLNTISTISQIPNYFSKLSVCTVSAGAILLPICMYNIYLARKFYHMADSQSSRKLFRYSLVYLPATLGVLLSYKTCLSSSSTANIPLSSLNTEIAFRKS